MAVLIDSSVFITLERRGLSLGDLNRFGVTGVPLLSSITAAELLNGVERAAPSPRRARRLAFIESIFSAMEVIPFDLLVARAHASVGAQLAIAGTPIGPNDLIIAATALAHGHTVMTDNLREFIRVSGLLVVQPTWPP
jgi:tRNA(fMet)-specific endonuclease VapC